jgi:fatty acid synthase subunit beta
VRECSNIVLIAGSGFGGAEDTYPYITGEWSETLGFPLMPFDGVLLGSRMMISKESHLSTAAKKLIALAEGTTDDEWCHPFEEAAGGVITVNNEMGRPLHKLATRGVLLWHYLDNKNFSIKDKVERVAELKKNRNGIIDRLNRDFQKPWFAVDWSGQNVELEDMTYLEVLHRMVSLMYVRHEQRWIDPSYMQFAKDFIPRVLDRVVMLSPFAQEINLVDPFSFLDDFSCCYPAAETEPMQAEDADYFVELCKRVTQKPIISSRDWTRISRHGSKETLCGRQKTLKQSLIRTFKGLASFMGLWRLNTRSR